MFDSAIQSENDSIAVMADLFAVGNRTGYFACGGQTGMSVRFSNLTIEFWYGETKLLHNAFDVAKPKTNVSFQGGHKLDLPEAPTHVRFTSDEKFVIVSMPTSGILYLDCDKLQEGVYSDTYFAHIEIETRINKDIDIYSPAARHYLESVPAKGQASGLYHSPLSAIAIWGAPSI